MSRTSGNAQSARLAGFLKNRRAAQAASDTIRPQARDGSIEVSEEQMRMWLHCALSGSSEMYNDTFSLRYAGEFNVAALQNAINEILKRHEAWRTSFEMSDDKVFQKIAPEVRLTLPVSDLTTLPLNQREKRLAELIAQDSRLPFRLTNAPLLRGRVIRVADRDSRLVLVIHHLISDGVSVFQVFLSELQAYYSAFTQHFEPTLPPLSFQYSDYAEWQRRSPARHKVESHLKFWDQYLEGELPIMRLPLDRPRPTVRKFDGGVESFRLTKEVTYSLKSTADAGGATVFMIALAAFNVLAYHYTGECDQILGCVTSTRKQFGTESLLGLFINMLPLRSRFSADGSYPELVRQVRENTLAALEHEVSFDLLVRRFGRRVPSITPLFQVVFVFEPSTALISDKWQLDHRNPANPFTKWDLAVVLQENGGHICGHFSYCRDIFNSGTIAGMRDRWVKLLGEVAVNSKRTTRELSGTLAKSNTGLRGLKWFRRQLGRVT